MKVWMAVTADKYELPILIGNSYQELAKLLNVNPTTVFKLEKSGATSHRVYEDMHFRVFAVEVENVEG